MARRKSNKETKVTEPAAKNMAQLVVEKGKKIAKEDFAKFSAIVAVTFSAGLWVVKSIWYAYMSGKFSVYKIDSCYINADGENFFLQIIQLAAIFVIWFFINYIYYKISVAEDKSRFSWKKVIKILGFWIVEMFISFIWILFSTHTEFKKLVSEITGSEVIAIVIVSFVFCLMVNIYAIEFLVEEWWKKRKNRNANNQESTLKIKREKRIKDMFLPIIVTIAIELIVVYVAAWQTEYNRCAYKLIMVQSEMDAESKFVIAYGANQIKYEMYPVAYENEDCYIVTRLFNDNGKISIDYNYQRIIEKEGQETIYIQNIYDIKLDN